MNDYNLYYQTLSKPSEIGGVRIPDDYDHETVTFTIVDRITLTVTAGGVAAICVGEAVMGGTVDGFFVPNATNSLVGVGGGGVSHVVGYKNHTTATSAVLFSNAATTSGSPPVQFAAWNDNNTTVDDLLVEARLVSAGMSARSTVGDLNNQGLLYAASLPRGYNYGYSGAMSLEVLTIDQVLAIPGVIVAPINTNEGVSMTYQPTDEVCLEFSTLQRIPDGTDPMDIGTYAPGSFLIAATGAYPTSTIEVTLVCNYEGVPKLNQLIFQNLAAAPIDDPIAIAEANNARMGDDLAKEGVKGFEGLHTENFAGKKALTHPLVHVTELGSKPTGGGIHIHGYGATKFGSKKSKNAGNMREVDQTESMFSKIANLALGAAAQAAPKLIASLL
jgi:hypothetical protein